MTLRRHVSRDQKINIQHMPVGKLNTAVNLRTFTPDEESELTLYVSPSCSVNYRNCPRDFRAP